MLLAPRQLRRAGMTGDVGYYGGRFTPAQAYAASHPPRRPPPGTDGRLTALRYLLDTGVIGPDEYRELRARVTP